MFALFHSQHYLPPYISVYVSIIFKIIFHIDVLNTTSVVLSGYAFKNKFWLLEMVKKIGTNIILSSQILATLCHP